MTVYAWCLMPNHFHLLVRTGRVPLSQVMRRLLTGYATAFNLRHGRAGHLFQNRYKSILVEEEPYFLQLVRYIHLNPLRGGVVQDLDALARYPWSGHGALLGKEACLWQEVDEVLARFHRGRSAARRRYRSFVADGVAEGTRTDLSGGGLVRSMGGWAYVEAHQRSGERWAYDARILGGSDFVTNVLGEMEKEDPPQVSKEEEGCLEWIIEAVAHQTGITRAELTGGSRQRRVVHARAIVSNLAVRRGAPVGTVARALRVSSQSILRGLAAASQIASDIEHIERM